MEQPQQRFLKVVLIGAKKTGKTCLRESLTQNGFKSSYKPTIGADFSAAKTDETSVQLWDVGGDELDGKLMKIFLNDSAAIGIVLDPNDTDNWRAQIQKCTSAVNTYKEKSVENQPEIFYVVTKWDQDDATQLTLTDDSEITQDTCRNIIKDASEDDNARVFFYSAKTSAKRNALLNEIISIVPKKANETFVSRVRDNEDLSDSAIEKQSSAPYFTAPRLFGFLVLFVALGTAFLTLGGVTGGVEHIWSNIGEFFNAIQSAMDLGAGVLPVADWGIGVLVASIGLAFVITVGSMTIDYYRKAGDEPGSEIEEQRKKGGYSGLEGGTGLRNVTTVHSGPLAAPQTKELIGEPEAPDQKENSGCTLF